MIPEAPILRISRRPNQYVIKCPYCEQTHYHGMRGGLGNRSRHCIDVRFMTNYRKRIFLHNKLKYGDETSYDIVPR
jgi:hypothetical protein